MYRTRLTLAIAALAAFVLFLAAAQFWAADRARYYLQRSQLAHHNLEAYLRLSVVTYQYFKQRADVLMLDEWRSRVDVAASRAALDEALAAVAAFTEEERDFVDEDEVESEQAELDRVGRLGQEIALAVAEFDRVEALFSSGDEAAALRALSELLETRIDGRFGSMVRVAIAEEEEEVEIADAEAIALFDRLSVLVWATAIGSAGFAGVAGFGLVRRLRRPLDALVDGTGRLAGGALEHRIAVEGRDEFAALAGRFNEMAGRLEAQRDALLEAQATLERKVDERTRALGRANAALRDTDAARKRFLADVSHELRTPLTVIRGEAEVTLRGDDKPPAAYRDALARIVQQVGQLGRLVDDLLLMARSQADAEKLDLAEVELGALLDAACRDAALLVADRDIALVPPEVPDGLAVAADKGRLTQLVFILLDNAVRYTRPGGRIAVAAEEADGRATIRVADTGVGIPADELAHVFDRFYRGTIARRLAGEGSGLGLPLAKGIAEAHGGTIAVASTEGEGTTVTVTLPALKRHGDSNRTA